MELGNWESDAACGVQKTKSDCRYQHVARQGQKSDYVDQMRSGSAGAP